MRPRHVFRHIGEAEPGERRIKHLERAVEDELALDMHLQLAAIVLEFPGVQSATRRQTQIQTSERMFEAEFLRLKARALVIEGGPGVLTDAQRLLEESLAIAQNQRARPLELRAAADLAQLHRDQGRHAEARALLAPVYAWFTEGFDIQDLKEAKALLDALDA